MRFFLLISAILLPFFLIAQQPLPRNNTSAGQRVIFDADTVKNIYINNVSVERLIGNVQIHHNNIVMTCDSAYKFPTDRFEAYSNVHVVNGSTTVIGDKMIYDGIANMAQVRGDIVYLIDSTSTLRTTAVDYNTKEGVGFFENEGTIKDLKSLLESKRGYYYSNLKDFVFIGGVQSKTENYTLTSDSMKYNTETKLFNFYSRTHIWSKNSYLYCDKGWYSSADDRMFFLKNSYLLTDKQEVWADSIYYEGLTKQGKLYRDIQLLDTVQKTIAFGDLSDFNVNTQDFEITIDPSILFYSQEQTEDTLYLRADLLKSVVSARPVDRFLTDSITGKIDTTYRQMYGIKNVRIFRTDFQASCDSLYFGTLDSIWKMYHNPVIWNESKMQLTGDTVMFFMIDGKMDRVEFQNNAMIILSESDSSQYYNQIKGKNMTGHFRDNELQRLDVFGNIQSLFFSSAEQAMNEHEAGNMTMRFRDKKMRQIIYYSSPTAKILPLFMTEKEQHTLKGFAWLEDERPKSKEDILTRKIKNSKRVEVDAMQLPDFPITKRMDAVEEKFKGTSTNLMSNH